MDSQNSDKKMFQGNWKCSGCSKDITELPFEPRDTNGLLCRDCHASKRTDTTQKKMFNGDWKCGSCGASIKQLPFEPRETGNLKCIDCFRNSR